MAKYKAYHFSLWGLFGLLGFLGFREFYLINVMAYVGTQNMWNSKRFIAFLLVSAVVLCLYLAYGYARLLMEKSISWQSSRRIPAGLCGAICALGILLPGLIKWFLPLPANFTFGYWEEFFLIYCIALIAAGLIGNKESNDGKSLLLIAGLITAVGCGHVILLKLAQVTGYPFTTFWSEGNRFFDYSTMFGSSRYIVPASKKIYAFITWGMQFPWALPFIFPNLTIGAYRLWYQLVWIVPTLLLGLLAAWKKPFKGQNAAIALVFAGWTFLFLEQGPIYTPLILASLFTLLAVRAKLPVGIVLIALASYYAKYSRWTWTYSPGLWAAMLTLLDIASPNFSKEGLKKLVKPATLGISGYFGGQILPFFIKNLSFSSVKLVPDVVSSATRQPLLWDRLLPNATFAPGILYGLLWAALPLIIVLVVLLLTGAWKANWMQLLAMLVIAGAYLATGLIASVKIGGGSNLHNLDNFLVTLVMIAAGALIYLRKADFDISGKPILVVLTGLALIAPVTFTLQGGARLALPDAATTNKALQTVESTITDYKDKGEILFMDQRQLLSFGMVKDVPFVSDYEKKYLMDQALAGNGKYFQGFYNDLKAGRFALIVNEPSNYIIRGSEDSFGEENDAYVKWVTVPLMCTYEPIYTSPEVGVQLLVPRQAALTDAICQAAFAQAGTVQ